MDDAAKAPVERCHDKAAIARASFRETVRDRFESLWQYVVHKVLQRDAGSLQRRVYDGRTKRSGMQCNFYIYYEMDDDELPTALRLQEYASSQEEGGWVCCWRRGGRCGRRCVREILVSLCERGVQGGSVRGVWGCSGGVACDVVCGVMTWRR